MRILVVSLFYLAFAASLTGCVGKYSPDYVFDKNGVGGEAWDNAGAEDTTGLVPGLPKGFHCPFVPNGFDPVGSIYRLDRSNTYYRVADLSHDPSIVEGIRDNVKIGDYVFSDTQKASADLSVSFLKGVLPNISASANANFNKELTIDIMVRDMHAKILYDAQADYIRDWFEKTQRPRQGNRYFLVREAIFAGNVRYGLSNKDLKKVGIKANVDQVADGSVSATFSDNGKKLLIDQKFSPPIQVCIKVAEFKFDRGGNRGALGVALLTTTDDAALPVIRRIGN